MFNAVKGSMCATLLFSLKFLVYIWNWIVLYYRFLHWLNFFQRNISSNYPLRFTMLTNNLETLSSFNSSSSWRTESVVVNGSVVEKSPSLTSNIAGVCCVSSWFVRAFIALPFCFTCSLTSSSSRRIFRSTAEYKKTSIDQQAKLRGQTANNNIFVAIATWRPGSAPIS